MGQFDEELLVCSNRMNNKFESCLLLKGRIAKYFLTYYYIYLF